MYNEHNHIVECIKPGRRERERERERERASERERERERQRERERERERETMGSRAVDGWDGWGQWQLSTAETRTDWRSDHPVVLDAPSAAIFSLPRARAAQ